MTKTTISPRIDRSDYAAIQALLPNDPDLPATYEEWQSLSSKNDAARAKGGYTVKGVLIKPQEFADYLPSVRASTECRHSRCLCGHKIKQGSKLRFVTRWNRMSPNDTLRPTRGTLRASSWVSIGFRA
jgi:hypothetical protein